MKLARLWLGAQQAGQCCDAGSFEAVDIARDPQADAHCGHQASRSRGRSATGRAGLCIGITRGVKKALIGKVLADDGGGSSEMIFRGIQWALDQGAEVISMSLGFDFPGAVERMRQARPPNSSRSIR